MPTLRAMTVLRLPRATLRRLKEAAAREGKSLNRLFEEMAEARLSKRPAQSLAEYRKDPIWEIGRDPWHSGVTDLAENHDVYLHGPVTYNKRKS